MCRWFDPCTVQMYALRTVIPDLGVCVHVRCMFVNFIHDIGLGILREESYLHNLF